MAELVAFAGRLTRRDADGALIQVGFIPDFPAAHADLWTSGSAGAAAVTDAGAWPRQFDPLYTRAELAAFMADFTPYMTSSHPVFAGHRLSCHQCHEPATIREKKIPDQGFYDGRVAMMVDGSWQLARMEAAGGRPQDAFGAAPLPAAGRVGVRGPVVILPAGAADKEAAAGLLAWMAAPPVLADASLAYGHLPTSRAAAQDPRLANISHLPQWLALLAAPAEAP